MVVGGEFVCSSTVIIFEVLVSSKEEIEGKEIIEIGSVDINGTIRPIFESWGASKYIGIDIESGREVDIICKAEGIVNKFGKESFDVVICNEVLEHIKDWQIVMSNIKNVCKPGGIIFITTRSKGFGKHGYPKDFWRYEIEDMQKVFSDCEIQYLIRDPYEPGVLMKAIKPKVFFEKDFSDYELYSINTETRIKNISDISEDSEPIIEKAGEFRSIWRL